MRRSALLLGGAACALTLSASVLWAPRALRHVDWFDVQRVEISGMHLLAPHDVLGASGVRRGQSVWEDPDLWEDALRDHPVIAEAVVARDFPRTLRIRIREERPVALVERGTLRPATASGALLPVDPTRAPVDLPLVRADTEAGADSLLSEAGRLLQLDPELIARVSEVHRGIDSGLVLMLSEPAATVALPWGTTAAELARLRAVIADVERQMPPDRESESRPVVPLYFDLRFQDQIVVRHPSSV